MPLIEFDPPDRFIADSVGPPGERVFFLQAARPGRVMTVSLEKEQVAVLGQRLESLLDNAAPGESGTAATELVADNAPMDTPIEDEFRVQELSLAWDLERRRVVIEAHEQSSDGAEHDEPEDDGSFEEDLARLEEELPGLAAAAEAALDAMSGDAADSDSTQRDRRSDPAGGDDEGAGDPATGTVGIVLRVVLSPAQAREFARRCARAVEGGRPNCPFCGLPLDPGGHICPRANGYRR